MKANKLRLAVLFTGFTSLSFAGPGIDYGNRMTEAAKQGAAVETKAKAGAPKPLTAAGAFGATCSCCAQNT